jgi:hypothetical protein
MYSPDRIGVISEDEFEILDDIDHQDYVYSTKSPEQKYDQMAQRTKVFDKKSLTKSLIDAENAPNTAREKSVIDTVPGWTKANRVQRRSRCKSDWLMINPSKSTDNRLLGKVESQRPSFAGDDFE